jgi:hypothetical protein
MVGQLGSLAALPRDVGDVVDVLRDLARRLQPLGQVAESAGGLFGLVTRAGGLRATSPAPASNEPAAPAGTTSPSPRRRQTAPATGGARQTAPAAKNKAAGRTTAPARATAAARSRSRAAADQP